MAISSEMSRMLKDSLTGNPESIQKHKATHPDFHWTALRYPKTGDTILHMACRNNHITLIKYLLTSFHPRATDCQNNDYKTPLHEAAQFCQFESCKTLLEFGANVNALKRADWTPLMLACTKIQQDSAKVVELLLQNGALINYKNKDGWTAVHLICREGSLDILTLLMKFDADIKIKTKNGRTPLHIAALHGHLSIVKELCSRNVDINEKDCCGNVPIHEAVLGNHIDICRELISRGVDIRCKNSTGFSLIHLCASQSDLKVIAYVIDELKFDVNEVTEKQFTALHCAARKNRRDVYGGLISKGANADIRDSFGRLAEEYLTLNPA